MIIDQHKLIRKIKMIHASKRKKLHMQQKKNKKKIEI